MQIFSSGSQESIFSEDFERTSRSHHRNRSSGAVESPSHRSNRLDSRRSEDVEVVHIPIPSRPGVMTGNRRESSSRSPRSSRRQQPNQGNQNHLHSSHPHLPTSGHCPSHHFPSTHAFLSRRSSATTAGVDARNSHHIPEVCVSPVSCDSKGVSSTSSKSKLFFPSSPPPAPVMMMMMSSSTVTPVAPSSGFNCVKTKVDVSVSIENASPNSKDTSVVSIPQDVSSQEEVHDKKINRTESTEAVMTVVENLSSPSFVRNIDVTRPSSSLPSSPSSLRDKTSL